MFNKVMFASKCKIRKSALNSLYCLCKTLLRYSEATLQFAIVLVTAVILCCKHGGELWENVRKLEGCMACFEPGVFHS